MSRATFQPTLIDSEPMHTLGQRLQDDTGHEYCYVQANGAIDQYDVVVIETDGQAEAITTALADRALALGVASQAMADNEYGWVSIYGHGPVNVKASCAADVVLYTSATAGHLDDTSSSQIYLDGIALTSARSASDGSSAGVWRYPRVS